MNNEQNQNSTQTYSTQIRNNAINSIHQSNSTNIIQNKPQINYQQNNLITNEMKFNYYQEQINGKINSTFHNWKLSGSLEISSIESIQKEFQYKFKNEENETKKLLDFSIEELLNLRNINNNINIKNDKSSDISIIQSFNKQTKEDVLKNIQKFNGGQLSSQNSNSNIKLNTKEPIIESKIELQFQILRKNKISIGLKGIDSTRLNIYLEKIQNLDIGLKKIGMNYVSEQQIEFNDQIIFKEKLKDQCCDFKIKYLSSIFNNIINNPHQYYQPYNCTNDKEELEFIQNVYESNSKNKLKELIKQKVNSTLYNQLQDFQKQSIEFAVERGGRCLIADEMGTGKTIQAIAIADQYQVDYCVVTLENITDKWANEIQLFSGIQDIKIVKYKEQLKLKKRKTYQDTSQHWLDNAKVLIMHYSQFCSKDTDFSFLDRFQMIILDECHKIKNVYNSTQMYNNMIPYLERSKRVILLSGTPMNSCIIELYNYLHIIRPDMFKSIQSFENEYVDKRITYGNKGQKIEIATNKESVVGQFHNFLNEQIMIKRSKEIIKLPIKKTRIKKSLEFNQIEYESKIMTNNVKKNDQTQHYLICSQLKIKGIINQIKEHIFPDLNNNKQVLFGYHKEIIEKVRDEVNDYFQKRNSELDTENTFKFIKVNGEENMKEDKISKFETDPTYKLAILSCICCSTGFNLVSANQVVFLEQQWDMNVLLQAEDRCYRLGQNKDVNIYQLHAKGTFDEVMFSKLEQNDNSNAKVLDGKSQGNYNFSTEKNINKEIGSQQSQTKMLSKQSQKFKI